MGTRTATTGMNAAVTGSEAKTYGKTPVRNADRRLVFRMDMRAITHLIGKRLYPARDCTDTRTLAPPPDIRSKNAFVYSSVQ
ncbi:hypothetical protein KL86DES1_20838 [uncultured Desulfovibrio sp.]|uniref:Uncharacterized protein n=1 Tax=uncultured Desulfovibrio sp. TaxID=167968 RepID=A0A212L5N5_9BACT|nr:hypothetical protein KL86DES1_20838 [uncultured Desulfovibrio sp.]VZH33741.1 conserved protein of unknown function [Desulfovibrio sp. 86]